MKKRLKEILDMLAAILTIIVSIVALKGTFDIYQSGFFHKMGHLIDHYHTQIIAFEKKDGKRLKDF